MLRWVWEGGEAWCLSPGLYRFCGFCLGSLEPALACVSLLVTSQEGSGGSSSASQAGLTFPQGQVNECVLHVALDTGNEAALAAAEAAAERGGAQLGPAGWCAHPSLLAASRQGWGAGARPWQHLVLGKEGCPVALW